MDEPYPYYQPKTPPPVPGSSVPPPVPPVPYPLAPPPLFPAVTADDRTMAMLCHLLSILTGFLGPLILWLVKKDTSPFVDHHGREALNFQITVFLVMMVAGSIAFVTMFIFIGLVLLPALIAIPVFALVAEIIACTAASNGQWHRYPCCMRLF